MAWSYEEALRFLADQVDYERLATPRPAEVAPTLERMARLCSVLGDPQHAQPAIHVTGTNGKGSVVRLVAALVAAQNLTVGTYTSPDLGRVNERIARNLEPIDDDSFAEVLEAVSHVLPLLDDAPTYFELVEAVAFRWFADVAVDLAVVEVGMGGRWDGTNVVDGTVAVVTNVGLDHIEVIGPTRADIAHEKAGILKRGCAAIIGSQPDEARAEIERVAARVGAPLHIANQDWQSFEQHGRLVFQDEAGLLDLPMPHLQGRHQIDNAGNAVAAVRELADPRVSEAHIGQGLKSVTWPARMQRLGAGHLSPHVAADAELWLDGGHNPSAGRVLAQAFSDLNDLHSRPLALVWGMLNTKDAGQFIGAFAGMAHRVVALTIPGEENAVAAETLAELARRQGLPAETASSLEAALRQASLITPAPRILICGSLYLAGRVLAAHA